MLFTSAFCIAIPQPLHSPPFSAHEKDPLTTFDLYFPLLIRPRGGWEKEIKLDEEMRLRRKDEVRDK